MLDFNTQTTLPNFLGGLSSIADPLQALESPGTLGNTGSNDGIARVLPPGFSEGGASFPIPGPLGGISNLLMQLIGMLGALLNGGGMPNAPGNPTAAPENFFSNAGGASTGDPHLSFSGQSATGNLAGRWDSMSGHGDLLDSDSVPGGFSISTTATAPNAQGVTYNASASITTNGGDTVLTYGADGNATISQNGNTTALARGQNLSLPGEAISWNADGSMQVNVDDGNGGTIATTLSQNGKGVDVRASAQNVDLGGDLVTGATQSPPQRIGGPIPVPPPILNPRIRYTRL
ncbi:MAG: hypothetical protein HKL91_01755 [Candidatus Eremiobacteraeota bacterium]|uniref:DUF1521 domain-containing protein n=1 Tax=mine drainage metagenome TaxID=410659 RepID=E6PFT8_9ZZZZ|nr:hypothetical protein [Candidatus Eremiobacteraeota bacterium]